MRFHGALPSGLPENRPLDEVRGLFVATVQVLAGRIGEAVRRPCLPLRRTDHSGQPTIAFRLVKRRGQHDPTAGSLDVVRIATGVGRQNGKSATQGLEQDHSGGLTIRGMEQKIRPQEPMVDVLLAAWEEDMIRNAGPPCLPLERSR